MVATVSCCDHRYLRSKPSFLAMINQNHLYLAPKTLDPTFLFFIHEKKKKKDQFISGGGGGKGENPTTANINQRQQFNES